MKPIFFIFLLLLFSLAADAQKPASGTYTYKVAFAEHQGRSLGASCTICIKGDSIIVINNGHLTGSKGEIIERGVIIKHKKTGKWIIGHSRKDIYAEEVGGCSDGPTEIDLRRRILWLC